MDFMKGLAALILAAIFGGLGPIFGKYALGSFSAVAVSFFRGVMAALILGGILWLRGMRLNFDSWKKTFWLGVFASGNIFFFIFGLERTTAIVSPLLYLLVPAVVLLLARIFFKEKITKQKIIGIGIGIFGALFIIWRSYSAESLSLGTPFGNFLILLGVFSWSCYLFVSQRMREKFLPEELTFYSMLMAAVLALAPFSWQAKQGSWLQGPILLSAVLGVILMALANSIFMVYFYQLGVRRTSAFTAGIVSYLTPLVTTLAAAVFLGERLSWELIFGGGLIMAGIFISVVLAEEQGKEYVYSHEEKQG